MSIMKSGLSLIVVLITCLNLLGVCSGYGLGKCPKHGYMKDFKINKIVGQWYEIERSFHLMELISRCTTIDLTARTKRIVEVSVKNFGRITGRRTVSEGIAVQSKKDPSVFIYKVNSILPNGFAPGTGFYQVLDTDYTNYAIVWKCTAYGVLYTDNIWILGRSKDINVNVRAHIYDLLQSKGIDSERLIIPKTNNCSNNFFR